MLKVALVGVGGVSWAHLQAWESMSDVELVALCDVRPQQMEGHPNQRHYTDLTEMLDKEELDILDICLPSYLHADAAVMALERGIHVLCEKPISLNKADVRRVYDTAAAHGVNFMVAQVLRFWPEYEVLKNIYDKQTYGKLLSGRMNRLGFCPQWSWDGWMQDEKRSGLVPFDLHVHDCDFMVYAFGRPVAITQDRCKREEQDYLAVTYRYPDFFITAEASWYAPGCYPFQAGFRFQFEKAVVEWKDGKLVAYPVGGEPIALMEQTSFTEGVINLTDMGPYANEIRYFADCVLQGVPCDKVKAEELETVLDLIYANL